MIDNESNRKTLLGLLDKTDGLTQAQLAERISFTPSKLSRLLSGDTELSDDDAGVIAAGIGTEQAKAFATHLRQKWRLTDMPGFSHVSRASLWKAEKALQDLEALKANPNLRGSFKQQIESVSRSLKKCADQLGSIQHPVALMGPPAVGKSTVACVASGLRREGETQDPEDLDRTMGLQTGGGRVTICEVDIRNGGDYGISVEPCSVEEVQQFVSEFCDDLLRKEDPNQEGTPEDSRIPSEIERAIRNMSELPWARKIKTEDGPVQKEDEARKLAREFPNKADLLVQILAKMNMPRRIMTSLTFPRGSPTPGVEWVYKLVGQINYGHHPDFPLPQRIEITVPNRILGAEDLDPKIADTRGIDEPFAPRRDLQAFLDDERCLVVLCTKFGDAPNGSIIALIDRAVRSGLRQSLVNRGLLLILVQGREDKTLRDPTTGLRVKTSEEGRDIKAEQIQSTLLHHGLQKLEILFVNAAEESDSATLRKVLAGKIRQIRRRSEAKIDELVSATAELVANSKDEESQALFELAMAPVREWIAAHGHLPGEAPDVQSFLLGEMGKLRYVSSLRASVNRFGAWGRFDYWLGLGTGARTAVVSRYEGPLKELKALAKSAADNEQFSAVHNLIKHFLSEVEKAESDYQLWAEGLGSTAFKSQLKEDATYWEECKARWGKGPGYRDDVQEKTRDWFAVEEHQNRREFIEAEIQKQWATTLGKLSESLSSGPAIVQAMPKPTEV
jgi:hypothetical protein